MKHHDDDYVFGAGVLAGFCAGFLACAVAFAHCPDHWWGTANAQTCDDPAAARAVELGADVDLVAELLYLETLAGVPQSLRGVTLAKVWSESRFKADAVGDGVCADGTPVQRIRRRRVCSDGALPRWRAVGCAQLWPHFEDYGADRADCLSSVRVWLERVVYHLEVTARQRCGGPDWIVAMNMTNRGVRYRRGHTSAGSWRCAGPEPRAVRVLRRWVL